METEKKRATGVLSSFNSTLSTSADSPVTSLFSLNPASLNADSADAAAGDEFSALLEKEVKRVKAAKKSYMEVLEKAAAARLADEALELIGTMREQRVPLDVHVYNAGLAACSDDLAKFDQLRSEMRDERIDANITNLAITTRVCEENDLLEMAFIVQKDLLRQCRTSRLQAIHELTESKRQLDIFDLKPPAVMYDALIRRTLDEGNYRLAYNYVLDMAEKKVRFAFSTVDAVINSCELQGLREEVQELQELVTPERLLFAMHVDWEEDGVNVEETLEQWDREAQVNAFHRAMAELKQEWLVEDEIPEKVIKEYHDLHPADMKKDAYSL